LRPRPDKIPLILSASCALLYEKPYFAPLYRARAHAPTRHSRTLARASPASCHETCSTTTPTTTTTTTTMTIMSLLRDRHYVALSFVRDARCAMYPRYVFA
jgi:hypothetical protein